MKKRALALVCAFAMGMTMCAGTNVSNTAKAAADGSTEAVTTPKVQIVGATISNQNGATQSLRFLMEVENYDQIQVSKGQDFGINLTVADKTVPVTYKNYNKIYAIDKTSNTLQYAVEINGINSDNIATDIIAQGFVTGLPSGEGTVGNVATSEKETRSVSSVATAAGYEIAVDPNNKNMTLNKNFGTECSLDLSKAQVLEDDKGTIIERDSFSGAIKAKNVYGIAVPIHDKGFVVGSDVEVTIHGTASGSTVRAWIQHNDNDNTTATNNNVTMDIPFTLKINKSVASSVLFIKAPYGKPFEELNISKIDVRVLPFEKPTKAPAPYTLEFNDKTVKGSWGGNAVINDNGTVTGTITGKYGNFEFDLPDEVVSNYYDTVTVKFKEANYQGKPEANIWMALDTVNNGLLTEEIEYNDRFHHVTEGEAVITAKSGPIKNVRILTGDEKPTQEKPFTFIIESVIFSNSKWINPDDVKNEYELELNAANVVAVNEQVALTFNKDNSVTIETKGTTSEKGGEFGFKIPRNIYRANDFRKIAISYRDSDLMEHSHHTQHFGTDEVGWIGDKDNGKWNGTPMMGTGTLILDLDPATEDGNFSNMRFFDLPKVDGRKMTITSVKLTKK